MCTLTECKTSPNYPKAHTVNGLTADFKSNEPDVKILWEAMDPLKTGSYKISFFLQCSLSFKDVYNS